MFTALHRLTGQKPGPITDELLDAAVDASLAETDDLEWKSELPPTKGLSEHDFPKDIAAMANSGGGVIVYGVEEDEKHATSRKDVGELDENHERTLRAAAFGAITPPVFGLGVFRVGEPGKRAVVVIVPASTDGPHLIFKNKLFGAPVRNDADTEWMKERQIEASYRARLDDRRHATEALANMYEEAVTNWSTGERAWLIAVARPRLPFAAATRPTKEDARAVIVEAESLALTFAGQGGIHPLANVDRYNPRPGLRRWNLVNEATESKTAWKAAWAAVHHDGSVGLAGAIGGHHMREGELDGHQIESSAIECAVADFMALIRAESKRLAGVS